MKKILNRLNELSRLGAVQFCTLLGILLLIAWRACQLKFCVTDPDVWWHLRVGDWMLASHAVPHTGIFSRTAEHMPWVAYSWGYEVFLSLACRWWGLLGIGVFGVLLTLIVAYTIFVMLQRLSGSFWIACVLSLITYFSMLFTMMPRPHFFSIALFALVITLTLEAQRNSSLTGLIILPFVFLIWANLHIQFIYGIAVFGLFVVVNVALHQLDRAGFLPASVQPSTLRSEWLLLILFASVLATLAGPNTYHLYRIIFEYSHAKFGYSYIRELQALDFRFADHFGQLFLTGVGFMVLGWQKKADAFKFLLLIGCAVVAFRTTRDGWFICIPASACIADFFGQLPQPEAPLRVKLRPLVQMGACTATVLLLSILFPVSGCTPQALESAVSSTFPVKAANFVRRYPVPGPLYNSFNWGGFLVWYLPDYPVAIDGRNDLYGDKLDFRFMRVQNGFEPYANDESFAQSELILLSNREYLTTKLSRDPHYRLIYQDELASVFVPSP